MSVASSPRGIAQATERELQTSIKRFAAMLHAGQFRSDQCRNRCLTTLDNLRAHLNDVQGKLISNRR